MIKAARPLLLRAVVIWVLYAVANILGMRHGMTLLSGTSPLADASMSTVECVVYLGLYLGAVIVAPILVIGSVIEVIVGRLCRGKNGIVN